MIADDRCTKRIEVALQKSDTNRVCATLVPTARRRDQPVWMTLPEVIVDRAERSAMSPGVGIARELQIIRVAFQLREKSTKECVHQKGPADAVAVLCAFMIASVVVSS